MARAPKYAKKVDKNHERIRDGFRKIPGHRAADTSGVGDGFPDLVTGGYHRKEDRHCVVLAEIKTDDGELTKDQVKFHDDWAGLPCYVVRSLRDLLVLGYGWGESEAQEVEEALGEVKA